MYTDALLHREGLKGLIIMETFSAKEAELTILAIQISAQPGNLRFFNPYNAGIIL